jgi:ADP-heptose:LPS heptosyltransferase
VLLEAVNGLIPYKTVALPGEVEWGIWGAILERGTLCLGNDTGATHLAIAAGCKTVFIFGPSDPRRYGPYAQPGQAAALWHPIAGMVDGVDKGPPRDWTWEEGVSADEAWKAAQVLLEPEQLPRRTDEEE